MFFKISNHRLVKLLASIGLGCGIAALTVGFLLFPHLISAETQDNINWGPGTHIVTSTVQVQTGTLTIQPGAEVRFNEGVGILVGNNGRLVAIGTASQPITFTSRYTQARGTWDGIRFTTDSLNGEIQHAVIEYSKVGLELETGKVYTVTNNTFRYIGDDTAPTNSGAIIGTPDNSTLSYNTIYSSSAGLQLNEASANQITHNTIFDIFTQPCLGFIPIGGASSDNIITDNTLFNCTNRGISLDDTSTAHNNSISANVITGTTGGAIYVRNQDNPTIANNAAFGIPVGSGLIVDGTLNAIDPADFNSNLFCVDGTFEIENRDSDPLIAEGNWLGTNFPAIGVQIGQIGGSIDFTPSITLAAVAVPAVLPADGTSTATVTLTMTDGAGHTVPLPGRTLNLATSAGSIPASAMLNNSGLTNTLLTAASSPSTATITVTEFCGYAITLDVPFVEYIDLGITKSSIRNTAEAGQTVTYTLEYTNNSNYTATNVIITDTLPVSTTFDGDDSSFGTTTGGGVITWTVGTVNPHSGGSFVITTTIDSAIPDGPITNTAHILGAEFEGNPADNVDTAVLNQQYNIYLPIIINDPDTDPDPDPTPTPVPLAHVADVAVDAQSNQVFVAGPRNDSVYIIDGSTDIYTRAIGVGNGPVGLAVLTSTNPAKVAVAHQYAANNWNPGAWYIHLDDYSAHGVADINYVGAAPVRVTANPNTNRFYYANYYDRTSIIDGVSESRLAWVVKKNFQGAYGIDVNPNGNLIYMATIDTGELIIFDAVLAEASPDTYGPCHNAPPDDDHNGDADPRALRMVAVNPTTGHVFVTSPPDTNKGQTTSLVYVLDQAVLLGPNGTNGQTPSETTCNWNFLRTTEELSPQSTAALPGKGWIKTLTLSGASSSAGQEGIAIDPLTGLVYVTDSGGNRVFVIRDSVTTTNISLLATLGGGYGFENPMGVDVNPQTNKVYVGNARSIFESYGTVSVLQGTLPFTHVTTINLH